METPAESLALKESPRQRTVHHLQQLYTVAVGAALTIALSKLLDQTATYPVRLGVLPYFIAYFVTIVPFYHGALRHLDATYFESPTSITRSGALMCDWSLLFVESCGLLGLAILLQHAVAFTVTLVIVIAFDCLWAFGAHLAFSRDPSMNPPEKKWATINFVACILLIFSLLYLDSLDAKQKPVEVYRWIVVVSIAFARTVWDYAWCWPFYYPKQ